jgi:hypothetical protein
MMPGASANGMLLCALLRLQHLLLLAAPPQARTLAAVAWAMAWAGQRHDALHAALLLSASSIIKRFRPQARMGRGCHSVGCMAVLEGGRDVVTRGMRTVAVGNIMRLRCQPEPCVGFGRHPAACTHMSQGLRRRASTVTCRFGHLCCWLTSSRAALAALGAPAPLGGTTHCVVRRPCVCVLSAAVLSIATSIMEGACIARRAPSVHAEHWAAHGHHDTARRRDDVRRRNGVMPCSRQTTGNI